MNVLILCAFIAAGNYFAELDHSLANVTPLDPHVFTTLQPEVYLQSRIKRPYMLPLVVKRIAQEKPLPLLKLLRSIDGFVPSPAKAFARFPGVNIPSLQRQERDILHSHLVASLAYIKHPGVVPWLASMVRGSNGNIRGPAARALASHQTPEARMAIKQLLMENGVPQREAARVASLNANADTLQTLVNIANNTNNQELLLIVADSIAKASIALPSVLNPTVLAAIAERIVPQAFSRETARALSENTMTVLVNLQRAGARIDLRGDKDRIAHYLRLKETNEMFKLAPAPASHR